VQSECFTLPQIYKCDMVLLAMGFLGPEKAILTELEIDQDARSNVSTPRGRYVTNIPRVYAAGDCRRGEYSFISIRCLSEESFKEDYECNIFVIV
jgi:NADPH-dependent glutamate synthase beta subunit-like oxidoreductase